MTEQIFRAIQIVAQITSESAGPSYSCPRLAEALQTAGCAPELFALAPLPEKTWPFPVRAFPLHRFPCRALGRSPEMFNELKKQAQSCRIMHVHGIWMAPDIYPEFASRGTECRVVISPRGMLSEWALHNSAWKKKIVGMLGQATALRNADLFHATAEMEYEDIRRLNLRQPVAVIPNGIDLPDQIAAHSPGKRERKLLFLGRIHPKKGLDLLLPAWRVLSAEFPNWQLEIVGPLDSAYATKLQEQAAQLPNVSFPGEANGARKDLCYASADLFVLPSFSENFGLTIAEALSSAVPVVTTDGTPWKALDARGCGRCIELSADNLIGALRELMELAPEKRQTMGLAGRQWMSEKFGWTHIGEQMFAAYRWCCGLGTRPQCVRCE